jgi:hypothetical protein
VLIRSFIPKLVDVVDVVDVVDIVDVGFVEDLVVLVMSAG